MKPIITRLRRLVYGLALLAIAVSFVGFRALYAYTKPKPIATCGVSAMSPPKYGVRIDDSPTLFSTRNRLGFSFDPANGEKLFKANCNACHILGRDMTGPNLAGVTDRWQDLNLLRSFIKNPRETKKLNDAYLDALWEKWTPKSGIMPQQPVTDEEINDILGYVEMWGPIID